MKTADTRKETRDTKSQIETTVQKQHVIVAAALPPDLQQGEEHLPFTETEGKRTSNTLSLQRIAIPVTRNSHSSHSKQPS